MARIALLLLSFQRTFLCFHATIQATTRKAGGGMELEAGKAFRLEETNPAVAGCTVSQQIAGGRNPLWIFSLGKGTDISGELYPYHKLLLVQDGQLKVRADRAETVLEPGQCFLAPTDVPVGMEAPTDTVYTELEIQKEDIMNNAVEAGKAFRLADLVPYQEGRIVNMDVVHNDKMKFVVMAFAAGTGLSEHAAPGDALIFALEGEGVIGYEGQAHTLKAGEQFRFAKNGLHWVKAEKPFKMGLLLTLE